MLASGLQKHGVYELPGRRNRLKYMSSYWDQHVCYHEFETVGQPGPISAVLTQPDLHTLRKVEKNNEN